MAPRTQNLRIFLEDQIIDLRKLVQFENATINKFNKKYDKKITLIELPPSADQAEANTNPEFIPPVVLAEELPNPDNTHEGHDGALIPEDEVDAVAVSDEHNVHSDHNGHLSVSNEKADADLPGNVQQKPEQENAQPEPGPEFDTELYAELNADTLSPYQIYTILRNRYGYDITKGKTSKKLPQWVYGSPLFHALKTLYKEKMLAKEPFGAPDVPLTEKIKAAAKAVWNKIVNVKPKQVLKIILGIVKMVLKGVDVVDDVIGGLARAGLLKGLTELQKRLIIGIIVSVLHIYNAGRGIYSAVNAIRDRDKKLDGKTKAIKVMTGVSQFFYGAGAITINVLYMVAYFTGRVIALPVVMFASAVEAMATFVAEWLKKRRVVHVAKRKEKHDANDLKAFRKVNANPDVLQADEFELLSLYGEKRLERQLSKQESRDAQRERGLARTEIFTGAIVLASAALALTLYLAATVFTGGALPAATIAAISLAALITGIAGPTFGFGLKLYEFLDDLNDNKMSKALRNWWKSWSLFSSDKKAGPDKPEAPKPDEGPLPKPGPEKKNHHSWDFIKQRLGVWKGPTEQKSAPKVLDEEKKEEAAKPEASGTPVITEKEVINPVISPSTDDEFSSSFDDEYHGEYASTTSFTQ